MHDTWTRRSSRRPREILDRVKALEVDAPESAVDERDGSFRLVWHRGFVYRPAPVLVGRVREGPGGAEVELRFEGDGAGFRQVLGWSFAAFWWLAVLSGMLPDPGIGAGTKGLALAGGGLVTGVLIGLTAVTARWARQDRERLRKLADELIGAPA